MFGLRVILLRFRIEQVQSGCHRYLLTRNWFNIFSMLDGHNDFSAFASSKKASVIPAN